MMKRLLLLCVGCLALLSGCARGIEGVELLSSGELAELPQSCEALLDACDADESISVGRVEGTSSYVVETSDGRCLSDGLALVDALSRHARSTLAGNISADLQNRGIRKDPTPHPDVSVQEGDGTPTPHPDANGTLSAEPSPHPDIPDDDDDSVVIIVWLILDGSGGTPPTPAPTPGQPASSEG